MLDLTGRRVLVVGGSSGIGLACAAAAREHGADVVLASRSQARLDAAHERLETGSGGAVETRVLDVRDGAAVARLATELGAVDHVVCTPAERYGGPFAEADLDEARRAFETKFWGPLTVAQHFGPRLAAGGSITLTSGAAAWTPLVGAAVMGAANGAIVSLVRALALELAPVRVNAVAPGVIDTPTWDALGEERRAALFARMAGALPLGRVGTAEDVAAAILALIGNTFTTGSVVHVDGGHRLVAP